MAEADSPSLGSGRVGTKTYQALLVSYQLPRHEAWPLLEAASGRSREFMIAHGQDPADLAACALFERMAALRQQGMPIAYLTGWREFYGRPFWVNRHTLIPRIDTELLIDTVVSTIGQTDGPIRLCDLGTGSGCIAITLALELKQAQVTATDASAKTLEAARNNAAWLGAAGRVEFRLGRWFAALAGITQRFHGLISNPPYVAAGDPHLQMGDLRFEPRLALTPGQQDRALSEPGLSDIAEIAQGASQWLEPGGFLLVEHGSEQQDAVMALFAKAGFMSVQGLSDQAGLPRAVIGFCPG